MDVNGGIALLRGMRVDCVHRVQKFAEKMNSAEVIRDAERLQQFGRRSLMLCETGRRFSLRP